MYPKECLGEGSFSEIRVVVKKGRTKVGERWYYDQKGFATIPLENAGSGDYSVELFVKWAPETVKDYVLRVYAENYEVLIKDAQGKTNKNSDWTQTITLDDFLADSFVS